MPRPSSPTFFGMGTSMQIFVLLVVYGLHLFVGGIACHILVPLPSGIAVYYGWMAGATFAVLGRCVLSQLSWALPAAVIVSGLNTLALAAGSAINWSIIRSIRLGDGPERTATIVLTSMAFAALLATALLIRYWRMDRIGRIDRMGRIDRTGQTAGPHSV